MLRAIFESGARVLLIGRRALVALGVPVMTADYDLWVHPSDVELLNQGFAALDHVASHGPAEARLRGRYVIENGEHIDVLIAQTVLGKTGSQLSFDDAWQRKQELVWSEDVDSDTVRIFIPSIDDLIATKQWAMRDKDIADIKLLQALKKHNQA